MASKTIHDASDEEDRMSSLPNHLLHHILRLVPTPDAVRMSVLSSRWQRVWIGLPTLAFDDKRSTAGFARSVDEVMAHSQGMDMLEISMRHPLHIARANEWLHQAAERVRQVISIIFHESDCERIVMDLPCGGRAAAMTFHSDVIGIATLVIPPAVHVHSSRLTQLELKRLRVDGSSLSNLVSSCCPNLKSLLVHTFGDVGVLKLSNDVLQDLDLDFYSGGLRRLEVSSRNLRRLRIVKIFSPEVRAHQVYDGSKVASFCTPRLESLSWICSIMVDPSRIEFAHSLSTIRQLEVGFATHALLNHTRCHRNKLALWLLGRCTAVCCLHVSLCHFPPTPILVLEAINEAWLARYEDLMVAVPQLSTVTDLTVSTVFNHHAYGASIATLLSRCSHVETLTITVKDKKYEDWYACAPKVVCWCKRPADWKEQKLNLKLLRQVDLMGFTMAYWLPDLVSLLCSSRPGVCVNYFD